MMHNMQHQYVERDTGRLCTERLCSDRFMQFLYSEPVREKAPWLFRLLTSHRLSSQLLALLSFDLPFGAKRFGIVRFLQSCGINLHECVDPDITTKTARAIFERQIRYWECRPMPQTPGTVVAPADARLVLGSLQRQSHFFMKEKFFAYAELLGEHQQRWLQAFAGGDVVICRLTPEQYHYTHCPVSGIVRDIYIV
jgi:phosphatidylserine decarboxylase